jgi:hypothetical protein
MKARQELTKTFAVDYMSEQDRMRYKGNFTIKKLSIRDLAALGVRKAQLNGGMHYDDSHPGRGVDEQTDDFNNMIAHLELSIKEAPEWWNLDNVTDVDLMGHVFKEVIAFEQSFLARKAGAAIAGRDDNRSGKTDAQEANTSGVVKSVVGEEVQAALEP